MSDGYGTTQRRGLFTSVTMAFRGTKSQRSKMPPTQGSGKTYSDIAGLTQGPRGGVAKKLQRKSQDMNGTDTVDFRISDVDGSGKRTLRSLSSGQGVISGKSSDVMYLTGQRGGGLGPSGTMSSEDTMTSSSRPAAYDVFRGTSQHAIFRNHYGQSHALFKSKSEPDLIDSGVVSIGDEEDYDDENSPGMFNRPGFGKTAFLPNYKFSHTLHSFDNGHVDHELTKGNAGWYLEYLIIFILFVYLG